MSSYNPQPYLGLMHAGQRSDCGLMAAAVRYRAFDTDAPRANRRGRRRCRPKCPHRPVCPPGRYGQAIVRAHTRAMRGCDFAGVPQHRGFGRAAPLKLPSVFLPPADLVGLVLANPNKLTSRTEFCRRRAPALLKAASTAGCFDFKLVVLLRVIAGQGNRARENRAQRRCSRHRVRIPEADKGRRPHRCSHRGSGSPILPSSVRARACRL